MMGRIGLSWVVSSIKGDSNGEAIEPIPYKKSADTKCRAINHSLIGSTPLLESAATQRQGWVGVEENLWARFSEVWI